MPRKFLRNLKPLFGSAAVLFFVFVAILAPYLTPFDPNRQNLSERLIPPAWIPRGSWEHPLGTDALGQDLLARLIYGSRISLIIGIVGAVASMLVGLPLALLAGYYRGWVDELIMRIADVFLSIPGLLLAIALVALIDPTIFSITGAFTLGSWAWATRTIRSEVLKIREFTFVEAAKAAGAGDLYIIVRHILPNTIGIAMTFITLYIAIVILYEASLSFLGFSCSSTSWGWDLAKGRQHLSTAWWISTFSGLAIFVVVLGLNFLGDWLRDYLDVKLD